MLRVLTLSTLFPNAAQPTLGIFVERQTMGLASRPDVELQVLAPVGLPPWPLRLHPHYRSRARLPEVEEWKGLRVHRPRYTVLPRIGTGRTARSMADALLPLLRDLRRTFPFDVIDAEFFWPDGPAAMHLSRALNVPFSIKARGSDINYWMTRPTVAPQLLEAARSASGLLAVSAALARAMAAHGMPEQKIRVHYTSVDQQRFRPLPRDVAREPLGLSGPILATIGALIPGKGQRVAIETAARIPGATLLLVGDGPDREALQSLARDRGVEDRVRLLGPQDPDEVAGILAAADVMLLPSRSEGLANVWVEALACGTPVVTTDVGGAREVIDRREAGFIVPADPDAMAAAIKAILADPPDRETVRRAADRFTLEAASDSLHGHLAAIAAAGSGG